VSADRAEVLGRYRRYLAACNRHAFAEPAPFLADVVVNGTPRTSREYADGVLAVHRAFPGYRWQLQRTVLGRPDVRPG
jgi:predicted ester cyclase